METYGLVAFAQSLAQYSNILTDYGFNFSATRNIAQERGSAASVSRIFCSVLLIKLALLILSAVILIGVVSLIPRFSSQRAIFFAAFLAVVGNALFPLWLYQGMEEMRYISAIIGLSRFVGAIALFSLVRGPHDALLSVLIQSLALVAAGLAGLWVGIRRFHLVLIRPTAADLRSAGAGGWHLFVSTAAISLYTNTNVILVGLLAGNVQAGYFSAAEKLVRAVQGLITPITQAVFPYMNMLAARSRNLALEFAGRTLKWMGTTTLAGSLAIFAFAGPIVSLLLGNGAAGCIPIVHWIAFLPFLIAVSNVLAVQTMIPFGLDQYLSRILLVAGTLNVVAACFLIPRLAAEGAGISVLFTEFFVTACSAVVLRHKNIRVPLWGSVTL
jgi:PST family polysaccharide transporter